jgi:hypothetical protein
MDAMGVMAVTQREEREEGGSEGGSRRPRRSKEELRQLVMDAGRKVLAEEGLGLGAGEVTFKRVLDRVEADTGIRLTNASVIRRVWENQAEFQTDVLAAVAAAGDSAGELGSTADAVGPVLAALDVSTPEARLASLGEICRVAGHAAFRALVESDQWSLWVGVWVLGATSPSGSRNRRIREALVEGYLYGTERWGKLHGAMLPLLGLRARAPLTLRQFTVSIGALVEGCALRQVGAEDLDVVERPTGPGGALQEWTLFAVGLEALALQYFELDPEWVPPPE